MDLSRTIYSGFSARSRVRKVTQCLDMIVSGSVSAS